MPSRWPAWPGWLAAVVGAVLAVTGFIMASLVEAGRADIANPAVLGITAVAGALTLAGGLAYEATRAIRARRLVPPALYRGPSVFVLLLLAIVLATLASIPFFDELTGLVTGEGEIGALATFVLLASNQTALLLVTGIFVTLPKALPGLPTLAAGRPLRSVALGLLLGAIAWLGATLLTLLIALGMEQIGIEPDEGVAEQALNVLQPWIVVPAVVILAPIAEEIFFRGVMYNAWRRQYGETRAIIGSSAVFAAIHFSLLTFVPIFLLGVLLAWLYRRTGSLLAAIVTHAMFNAISTLLAMLVRYEVINLPVPQ